MQALHMRTALTCSLLPCAVAAGPIQCEEPETASQPIAGFSVDGIWAPLQRVLNMQRGMCRPYDCVGRHCAVQIRFEGELHTAWRGRGAQCSICCGSGNSSHSLWLSLQQAGW